MNGQPRRTMHVECFPGLPGFGARQPEMAHPRQQIRQGNPRLHARKRRAKARMDAMSERDMQVGMARDVEAVGIVELLWVAVCSPDHCEHQLACRNYRAMHFSVALWGAHEPLDGRAETQNFFD